MTWLPDPELQPTPPFNNFYQFRNSRAEGISNDGYRVIGTVLYHNDATAPYFLIDAGSQGYADPIGDRTATLWDDVFPTLIGSAYVTVRGEDHSFIGSGYAIASSGKYAAGSAVWRPTLAPNIGEGATTNAVWFQQPIPLVPTSLDWDAGGEWAIDISGNIYSETGYAKAISDAGPDNPLYPSVRAGGFRRHTDAPYTGGVEPSAANLAYWDSSGAHYPEGSFLAGAPGEFRAVSGNGSFLGGRRRDIDGQTSPYIYQRNQGGWLVLSSAWPDLSSSSIFRASVVNGLSTSGTTAVGYDGYAKADALEDTDYYQPFSGCSVRWTSGSSWDSNSNVQREVIGDFVTRGPNNLPTSVASEAHDVSGDGEIVVGRALAYDEVLGAIGTRFKGYIWRNSGNDSGFGELDKWLYVNDALPAGYFSPKDVKIKEVLDVSSNGAHVCGVASDQVFGSNFQAFKATLPDVETANKYFTGFVTAPAGITILDTPVKVKYRQVGNGNSTPPVSAGSVYDSVGQFALPIPSGSVDQLVLYSVYVKMPRFLSQKVVTTFDAFGNTTNPVHTVGGDVFPGFSEALYGDCDNDDYIGTDDYLIVSNAFDTVEGDPLWDPRADLTQDGVVTTDDYLLVSANFDVFGDAAAEGVTSPW